MSSAQITASHFMQGGQIVAPQVVFKMNCLFLIQSILQRFLSVFHIGPVLHLRFHSPARRIHGRTEMM